MKHITKIYSLLLANILLLTGCERFVDIEPKGQLIPSTAEDFRMLLDQLQHMNFTGALGDLASDDMYFSDTEFQSLGEPFERNTYVWNRQIYMSQDQAVDWNRPYSRIYTANIILEGLEKTDTGTPNLRRTLEGEALFHRAIAHFEVVSFYAKSYDPATAANELGVPLRLASDVFAISDRPTLEATYAQILRDLHEALPLLPARPTVATRASKAAVFGMLARIHLEMGQYEPALEHALEALKIQPDLMDYNEVDPNGWPTFDAFNSETVFFSMIPFMSYSFFHTFPIPVSLYDSYAENDLRKTLFFYVRTGQDGNPIISLDGTYGGVGTRFTGLGTDELHLIVAETYARAGAFEAACAYLNNLLETRFATGTYVPFQSEDESEILHRVIEERRKQLIGRNRRWNDLKRLGNDSRFAFRLERTVLGTNYTLPPGDVRWVFPIPQTVIDATGMAQNSR